MRGCDDWRRGELIIKGHQANVEYMPRKHATRLALTRLKSFSSRASTNRLTSVDARWISRRDNR